MASIDTIKNREIRGCIMRALGISKGRAISNTSLANALISVCTDLDPYLFYLADKGYISIIPVDNDDMTGITSLINITAKGIDLMEGNIPDDPGITL